MLILLNLLMSFYLFLYPLLDPFLPNVKVNYTDNFTHRPCIGVAPSGIVYVVYNVDIGWVPPESTHIYINMSFDKGSTFVYPDRMIIKGNKYNECLALEVDKNERLHLIYEHYPDLSSKDKLYYASSTDSGQSFPLITQVDDNPGPVGIGLADIAVDDSGYIYVVWNDQRLGVYYSHIYFSKSTDGGISFSENVRVDTGSIDKEGYQPRITLDNQGIIYITWKQKYSDDNDIYFCKSTDEGNSFTEKVEVDPLSIDTHLPSLTTIGSDSVFISYIAWSDTTCCLYMSRSIDGGSSFNNTVRVNDSLFSFCDWPVICATKDGRIHLIWQMIFDELQETEFDIYYDFSTDGGLTFNSDIMVNDDSADSARHQPSLDKDSNGDIYTAWMDWRNGPGDIYFARTMESGVKEEGESNDYLPASPPCKFYQSPLSPFSKEITIKYQVLFPSYVILDVLDLTGRVMKTLVDGKKQAGLYRVVWKGDSSQGKRLSSGVYFIRLKSGGFSSTKKVLLVRRIS